MIDHVGNVTKTYYHQGNGSQSSLGEYDDHVSKPASLTAWSSLTPTGNGYKLSVNKWGRYAINATSSFVKLASTTELTYDGDSSHKDKAKSYTYDNANGNLTQKVEWGEVTGSTDGSFTDTGSDKRTTDITYAASSTGWLFAPKQETVKNQSGTTISDTKYYYDAQSSARSSKAIDQDRALGEWRHMGQHAEAVQRYGLVTQDTDARQEHHLHLRPVQPLRRDEHQPALTNTYREYDYSSGKVTKTIDPNGRVFTTTYDGLDRPTEEKQPDLTTPSTLVTKATYAYADASVPTSVHKTDYLDASTTVDCYQYFDGLARPIQTRREAESAGTYIVADTVYDAAASSQNVPPVLLIGRVLDRRDDHRRSLHPHRPTIRSHVRSPRRTPSAPRPTPTPTGRPPSPTPTATRKTSTATRTATSSKWTNTTGEAPTRRSTPTTRPRTSPTSPTRSRTSATSPTTASAAASPHKTSTPRATPLRHLVLRV